MGCCCTTPLPEPIGEAEAEEPIIAPDPGEDPQLIKLQTDLKDLLRGLLPEDLLIFALDDPEVYEVCKSDVDLRQTCIVGAVRRYHYEKYFYREVNNGTADYMVVLEELIGLQEAFERGTPQVSEEQSINHQEHSANEEQEEDIKQADALMAEVLQEIAALAEAHQEQLQEVPEEPKIEVKPIKPVKKVVIADAVEIRRY